MKANEPNIMEALRSMGQGGEEGVGQVQKVLQPLTKPSRVAPLVAL